MRTPWSCHPCQQLSVILATPPTSHLFWIRWTKHTSPKKCCFNLFRVQHWLLCIQDTSFLQVGKANNILENNFNCAIILQGFQNYWIYTSKKEVWGLPSESKFWVGKDKKTKGNDKKCTTLLTNFWQCAKFSCGIGPFFWSPPKKNIRHKK